MQLCGLPQVIPMCMRLVCVCGVCVCVRVGCVCVCVCVWACARGGWVHLLCGVCLCLESDENDVR